MKRSKLPLRRVKNQTTVRSIMGKKAMMRFVQTFILPYQEPVYPARQRASDLPSQTDKSKQQIYRSESTEDEIDEKVER